MSDFRQSFWNNETDRVTEANYHETLNRISEQIARLRNLSYKHRQARDTQKADYFFDQSVKLEERARALASMYHKGMLRG